MKRVKSKVDTGATRTSVDVWLAANIGLGPTVDVAKVKSAFLDEVTNTTVSARDRRDCWSKVRFTCNG